MTTLHLHESGSSTGVGTYVTGLSNALDARGIPVRRTLTSKRERVILGKRVGGYLSQIPGNWRRPLLDGCAFMHATCNWSLSTRADSLMIHDLNPLLLRELGTARWMFRLQKPRLPRRVLLVPSQATKEGVMRWLRCDPDEVHVAPHGIDHTRFQAPDEVQRGDYLVYSGDYRPYKRLEEGIRLAHRLGLGFIRAGPPGNTSYAASVQALGRRLLGRRFQDAGYVPRDTLVEIYGHAQAMWFPSKWEGFGLPPLEAAACGTPSIVADTPVMRELHGDLGVYLNGHLPTLRDIEDAQRPRDLVRNARQYTWARSVEAHLEAWRQGGLL